MHCGKKCGQMQCIVVKSDEFENSSPLYIFPLNPDYVAARSLRSLRSNDHDMINSECQLSKHLKYWEHQNSKLLNSLCRISKQLFYLNVGTAIKFPNSWIQNVSGGRRKTLSERDWLAAFSCFLCVLKNHKFKRWAYRLDSNSSCLDVFLTVLTTVGIVSVSINNSAS